MRSCSSLLIALVITFSQLGCKNDIVEPEFDNRILRKINDYQYKRNTYFFLDKSFRDHYRQFSSKWIHTSLGNNSPVEPIKLYKSTNDLTNRAAIQGIAYNFINFIKDTTEFDEGFFIELTPGDDYFVEPGLGYIRMNAPISDNEILAVAYRDANGNILGDINFDRSDSVDIQLKLIKRRNSAATSDPDNTWHLEWKNVYSLGGRNISPERFGLKIFFKPASGNPQETLNIDGDAVSYLQIFNLDERDVNATPNNPDNIIDLDPNIINFTLGELLFPDLRPFDPEGIILNGAEEQTALPESLQVAAIYDTSSQSFINSSSNFFIEIKSQPQ